MKAHLLAFMIAACCTSRLGAAQLVFDQPQVEIALPIESQEVRAAFPFRNTSAAAVRILEVKTECDCIQTSVSPHEIEAGKTGEVIISFRSKRRNGTDTIRAKVVADNGEIHEISVTAKLRSYIEVSPLALQWKKDEERTAKEFIVSSTGLGKLHFSKVAAVKDSKAEMLPDADPSSIRVLVTPPAGDKPFQGVVLVIAVLEESNETKIYDLHLRGE